MEDSFLVDNSHNTKQDIRHLPTNWMADLNIFLNKVGARVWIDLENEQSLRNNDVFLMDALLQECPKIKANELKSFNL